MHVIKKSDAKNLSDQIAGEKKSTTQPLSLRVADVMTHEVVTLSPKHTFADIVSLMARHSFRHYLVAEPPRHLVGVISDRDVLRAMARTPNWHTSSVQELMSPQVVVVSSDTDLSVAAGMMLSNRINCLPVVDDRGDICGVITSTDLLKSYQMIQELAERGIAVGASTRREPDVVSGTLLQEYKDE